MAETLEMVNKQIIKRKYYGTETDKKGVQAYVNLETGETVNPTFIRYKEVDQSQFVKLYIANISTIFDLQKTAGKVFEYIIKSCLKPTKDMFVFNMDDCKEYTGYKSKSTIYQALAELCEAKIIARGWSDSIWFLNPLMVFNGDRAAFINAYLTKVEEPKNKLENSDKEKLIKMQEDDFTFPFIDENPLTND